MGADFLRNTRQSVMGRASSGVDRRGGRRGGGELMHGLCEEWNEAGYGSPIMLRKPAVDLLRTCHFQGANIFR